jgi:hypothetical protein
MTLYEALPIVAMILVWGGVMAWLWDRMPRKEFASVDLVSGRTFALEALPPSELKSVSLWIQVDMTYPRGERISGPIEVSVGGRTVLREQLALGHGRRIIEGPPSGFRHKFLNMQIGDSWTVRGHIRLKRLSGAALQGPIRVTGTPEFGPHMRVKTARLYACR